MSTSPQAIVQMEEEHPLNINPGTGDTPHKGNVLKSCNEQSATSCCHDRNHRKLAICSIICGLSCIGIKALINSVKAENTTARERAKFSQRAKKFGIISIVVWVAILASVPILMALISYLLTLQD